MHESCQILSCVVIVTVIETTVYTVQQYTIMVIPFCKNVQFQFPIKYRFRNS